MEGEATPDYEPREDLREVSCTGGGPLDGKVLALRKYKGFVAVLKGSERVWIYDVSPEDDVATCREPIGIPLDKVALNKARDEWHYDIIALGEDGDL